MDWNMLNFQQQGINFHDFSNHLPSLLSYQPLKTAEKYIQNYQQFFEFQF
jgi:hypothetical protein